MIPQLIQQAIQHIEAGELSATEDLCQQILELDPQNSDAWHLLGAVNAHRDQNEIALEKIQQAITLNPSAYDYYNSLGNVLTSLKRFTEAVECYRRTVQLSPQFAQGYQNLGIALIELKCHAEAVTCLRRALTLEPQNTAIHQPLALALRGDEKISESTATLELALSITPDDADLYYQLSINKMVYQGQVEEGIVLANQALDLNPYHISAHQHLLMTLNYSLRENSSIFKEYQKFDEQHAMPLATLIQPPLNPRTPTKRLNIGYVSGDFYKHSVAYFLQFLAHHDHTNFEIFCYHTQPHVDDITKGVQGWIDNWCQVEDLSDDALAAKIRADQIDILVDLSGHTNYNRLLTFARKPAPIQINYLGLPTTTGIRAIDYRLTDNYVDVAGLNDNLSAEEPLPMPASLFCYQPNPKSPAINELPSLSTGQLTFGCFNHSVKYSLPLLTLWAKILNSIDQAKLLLKLNHEADAVTKQELTQRFLDAGCQPSQLIFEARGPAPDYLKTYHQIDIALDTYPFNGGTTTCEALWMGIPVVTWVGTRQVSRLGLSILSTIGLTQLIAHSPEEYLRICIDLAQNPTQLQTLRATMRERMQNSPLMDAPTFTQQLELRYRKIWEKFRFDNFSKVVKS